jgi:hypothetical protein
VLTLYQQHTSRDKQATNPLRILAACRVGGEELDFFGTAHPKLQFDGPRELFLFEDMVAAHLASFIHPQPCNADPV